MLPATVEWKLACKHSLLLYRFCSSIGSQAVYRLTPPMTSLEKKDVKTGTAKEELDKLQEQEHELLSELAGLLDRKPKSLTGSWQMAKQTGYCLHCSRDSRVFLPFLELQRISFVRQPLASGVRVPLRALNRPAVQKRTSLLA